MFCSKCGLKLQSEDRFCSKCGTTVRVITETTETEVSEPVTEEATLTSSDENKISTPEELRKGTIGLIVIAVVLVVGFGACNAIGSNSYSPPTDPSNMTNKEMNQFLEWKQKENQREHDNRKWNE